MSEEIEPFRRWVVVTRAGIKDFDDFSEAELYAAKEAACRQHLSPHEIQMPILEVVDTYWVKST